ncbi:tetratricopeptide repeat protein [Dictyocaulus viviparus]|uniref:Tetratricopeptide repeat protein n=1 Tax=Dictyocaulus viviparus TaxID=29172 RepID=A0A0D8XD95_DICVI|nr:tetratricopeptide repeat protein [Dictyocaulus viviparus]
MMMRAGLDMTMTTFKKPTPKRYLEQGDHESATLWIDMSYARKCETSNLFEFAQYIKDLTAVQQYKRVSQLILNRHLVKKHLVFAYYYVNALFHLRMYSVIVQLPIGNLMPTDGLPVRYPDAHCGLEDYLDSLCVDISRIDVTSLDKMVISLKLFSALMVVYGRTYILLENRDFATRCLTAAFLQDRNCLAAEQLLRKYKLIPITVNEPCCRLMERIRKSEIPRDPRQKTELAYTLYRNGDVAGTLSVTTMIMEEHGLYMDCVILHANCLCYFHDWKKLFLLAHDLVFSFPDHHYSWYTVAIYYFSCGNTLAAKNFINKAALMRPAFGEAWIAYGHILASESENEQALNCYYRAARILPWHYEPKMYIGMQYCRVGVRMAEDFLREASCIRSCDPIIMHERGSYYYRYNKFRTAEQFFNSALLTVIRRVQSVVEIVSPFSILNERLDHFWQPLISNLGHVNRRLGKYRESICFHNKALMMNPADWHSMASMAMSYACLGEANTATRYFAKSLARAPYDGMLRNALDKLAQLENDYGCNAMQSSRDLDIGVEYFKGTLALRHELARSNSRKKVMESVDQHR